MHPQEFNFFFFLLGFILTTILATATAIPLDETHSPSLISRYTDLLPRGSCICTYDPEDPSKWEDCVERCHEPEKRVYFSERDLSQMTRAVCYCPFNQTNCDCGPPRPRPPKRCCGIIHPPILLEERDPEEKGNTTPVLHARACPPNQEQHYEMSPPRPPICPLCVSHKNGTIVCPRPCPPPPVICPLYCIDYPNGTVVCPGCGDRPPRTYTNPIPLPSATTNA
uniref:Uncharacterized protein n=1 Tax=Kwoniella bestiolae CBS 10118 TaxID=1296100 RepID=A0A1B9G2X5_9TREE|nr:hypothetical protein I302_05196 [Kwoniella bestiolae CBS 10118]OCF25377.1 hypothetical protein I302_05196 [Kwoniella bestiolae CBS 10118]